jgi:hypothetical protein
MPIAEMPIAEMPIAEMPIAEAIMALISETEHYAVTDQIRSRQIR